MTTPYQTLALPVDSIQSHPENDFTMDESEMQELVASIRSEGLGQLPLVRKLPDGAYQMMSPCESGTPSRSIRRASSTLRIAALPARTRPSEPSRSRSSTTWTTPAPVCCSMLPTS